LVADGAVYRVGIVHAKAVVADRLRVASLIQIAVDRVIGIAGVGMEAVVVARGGWIQMLVPVAVAAFPYLSRKKMVNPAIGAGLAMAAVIGLNGRRKRS
jgi:hypothetical protein